MSVDREEVGRIAELARLRLDDDEVERLAEEMTRILEHAAVLRELPAAAADGEDLAPPVPWPGSGPGETAAGDGASGTRAPGADRPDALAVPPSALAPRSVDGFFVVPPPPGVSTDDAEVDEG